MDTKVSLVIRTLNEEENIFRCLSCVAKQTVLPDEILIVDNESTDATLAIAEGFKDTLPLRVISNPVRGYVSGLNLGAAHAKYEVVGFLSADCFPDKDWLKNLLQTLDEGDCAVVSGVEILDGENDAIYVISRTNRIRAEDRKLTYFFNSNILYRKKILDTFLPFRGFGEVQEAEDILLSIEYKKAGLRAMLSGSAVVSHRLYESMDDFKKRTYFHGESILLLFQKYPARPRLYLNPFYWAFIEYMYFFRFWDVRFLRVASIRLIYTVKGMLK